MVNFLQILRTTFQAILKHVSRGTLRNGYTTQTEEEGRDRLRLKVYERLSLLPMTEMRMGNPSYPPHSASSNSSAHL